MRTLYQVLLTCIALTTLFGFMVVTIDIPKPYIKKYLEGVYVPLADSTISINYVPEDQYEKLATQEIYKSYPVYLPGREPEGYYESLSQLEPEVVFKEDELTSNEDWVKAGELVFDYSLSLRPLDSTFLTRLTLLHDKEKLPVGKDGIIPFYKLVVPEKGVLLITGRSCVMCHTKIMPDSSIIKGAQGNFPFDPDYAEDLRGLLGNARSQNVPQEQIMQGLFGDKMFLFGAPWIKSVAQQRLLDMSPEDFIENIDRAPSGVVHRHGTNIGTPASIPDLYNLKDRKYLDHTGLMRHRSIEDLMLYATFNEETDFMSKYNDYNMLRPWPNEQENPMRAGRRYSDAQLYALAKYIYSLNAPKNPISQPEELVNKGQRIFAKEGCVTCHAPPYFSNNMLLPVDGFTFPKSYKSKLDIFDISVGTDPQLAMSTRRGTGFYKVPSLIGVWNRQALLHDGSISSLEELLSKERLQDNFERTGYNATYNTSQKVEGHPFGLELSTENKQALIAYVNSL
ncbi:hypothetical protein DFQ03_3434 [Maribacter caenipelagi]|uniref:Cytochrome c domain-containing protein n=1 Tax=Maribacter caenipelagi TaxID=1447781 RepID=A0A4R7CY68_9FLAO|nr:hypothetical protein [Maribacter caenipelagi]TDS12045.1 hypothetical protein DFQ03_3434 [Maribacter caenipelagi]